MGLPYGRALIRYRGQRVNLADWIRSRRARVYYGWWIMAVSSAVIFFGEAIYFRGFNIFFVPVRDSLGFSNFQSSLVFSLARAQSGLVGPVVGPIIDRFGNRQLVLAGIAVAGLGYLAFSRVDSFLWFALVYLGMISLGNNVALQHALFTGINTWFPRRRALVMALYTSIGTLGIIPLMPLMSYIILNVGFLGLSGWRWAAIIAGIVWLLLLIPLALVHRSSPESMGLLPGRVRGTGAYSTDPGDFSVAEALRTQGFWFLILGSGLRELAVMGVFIHLQPMLHDWKGVSLETVGFLFSFMMGVSLATRMVAGWAADKWPKALILSVCMAFQCISVIFLLAGSWESSPWAIVLFLVLLGVGDAAGVLSWATVGDFYGRRRFASIRGIITFSSSLAVVASPTFVGMWADHTGCGSSGGTCSYALPMWIAVAVLGLSGLSFALMRKPQRPPSGPSGRPG